MTRLLLAIVALCLPFTAHAADTWTTPHPGIRRLHRTGSNQNINVLVVDLCAPGVSLRATASGERGRTPSSFGTLVGAHAAINGDFFRSGYVTDGLAMSGGANWSDTADHGYVGALAAGDGEIKLLPHEQVAAPEGWMREMVGGHPTLLAGGVLRNNDGDSGLCVTRHPRTAIGLSQDRRTLFLAVVDGRATTRVGMGCTALGQLLQGLGAHDAMNLDGGGSSAMWVRNLGVVNYPSDGSQRTVGNHLAVFARGTGPATHCRADFRATFTGAGGWPGGTSMTLHNGAEVSGWLEFRNTGTRTWTPAKTRLGTSKPRDMSSPLATAGWLGPNRAAAIDRTVPPGAIGRFNFKVRAPVAAGTYTQHFNLVEEGVTWFADSGGPADDHTWLRVTSVVPDFRAEPVSAGGWPGGTKMKLTAGSEATGWLELKNTGGKSWIPSITNLGTTQPRDRASKVQGTGWLGANRAATIDRNVPPGGTGRFTFTVRAPSAPGVYRESFNLVQEGIAWFGDSGGPADGALQLEVTSVAPVDAGTPDDAGQVELDAGTLELDAGMNAADAGVPDDDAGGVWDAGTGEGDAGASANDAGASPDADVWEPWSPPPDAGESSSDAGSATVDGSEAEAADVLIEGGCGCGAAGGGPSSALAWALALALARWRARAGAY